MVTFYPGEIDCRSLPGDGFRHTIPVDLKTSNASLAAPRLNEDRITHFQDALAESSCYHRAEPFQRETAIDRKARQPRGARGKHRSREITQLTFQVRQALSSGRADGNHGSRFQKSSSAQRYDILPCSFKLFSGDEVRFAEDHETSADAEKLADIEMLLRL